MVVIVVTTVQPALRGYLTRWLNELDAGVYVGQLNTRVAERLWDKVCQYCGDGHAIMATSDNSEQGYSIRTIQSRRRPVDFDGLVLVAERDLEVTAGAAARRVWDMFSPRPGGGEGASMGNR